LRFSGKGLQPVLFFVFLAIWFYWGPVVGLMGQEGDSLPSVPQLLDVIGKVMEDQGQQPDGTVAEWTTPIKLVLIFTLLAILPSLVIMMTSFTRIVVVLGFVRRALSTQSIPPNIAIIGLAMFLTLYTMAPTFYDINNEAVQPYLNDEKNFTEASVATGDNMKEFMIHQTRKNDLAVFMKIAKVKPPSTPMELPFHIIVPSFIISEFRTAFEMGCLIFVPFLLLDLVIASVLLSAGMMMLPPQMISLPFKLILFILVDGWGILANSLSLSFS
jgi:flagellar biosynthetic protein FliP